MQRIVIVGGGVGGTMLANLLVVRLYPEDTRRRGAGTADFRLAGSLLQAGLHVRRLRAILPRRSETTAALAAAAGSDVPARPGRPFRFPRQELQTRSGRRHGYDYLVIATGCVPAPERIEGLKEAGDHFYQYQPARRLAERLASLESGRVFITVSFPRTPNVPHQCGIAPVETTLMLDDYLRRRGVRERVEIVYTYPTTAQLLRNCLFLQRPTCEILPSLFEQRGIRFQRGFTLARVDPERRIAYSEEGDEQPFDLLMATPPIHAVDAVRSAACPRPPPTKAGCRRTMKPCRCMASTGCIPWAIPSICR